MNRTKTKVLEKITMDRKIIEGLREGYSVNSLCKSLGKGKGYIIKIRDLGLAHGYLEYVEGSKRVQRASRDLPPYPEVLFPWRDGRSERVAEADLIIEPKLEWIKSRLEAQWSPQTVFEELSLSVPRSTFYRYLKRHKLLKSKTVRSAIEIIHSPGECLQLDWGKLTDVKDSETGKKKTVWMFVGTLGHSRYEMVRVVERLDFVTTMKLLIEMFDELGGVPRKVVIDNPKVFVQKASSHEAFLNPAFERFASHYGVVVEALPPASPELKGKVERQVPVKRRLFESYDFKKYTQSGAQAHIDAKLKLYNERKHGTHQQRPIDVLVNDEIDQLKSLPVLGYEMETIVNSTVRADGYVRFDNKYYRVDSTLRGEVALAIGNSIQVSIYCRGRLLEAYERIQDKFTTKACKDHYKESWEKTLEDHGHYLKRAEEIGPNVGKFTSIVLAKGQGFVDTRVIWGLLTLNKKYTNSDIDKACLSALELSQANLKTVRQLLNIMASPKPASKPLDEPNTAKPTGGKFARPMSEYTNQLRLVYSRP